eukprot:g8001.t1
MKFSHYMYKRQQEMNVVATLIQACFRGNVGRKRVKNLRERIYLEHSAAVTLQYFWHQLKRRIRRWKFQLLMNAAAKLQSVKRRHRDSEHVYNVRTQAYREKRLEEINFMGQIEWGMIQDGAAITIQVWFRKERARIWAPFIRIRRRKVATLMLQALFRGYVGRQEASTFRKTRTENSITIQRYYRKYRRNLAWRHALRQGIIRRLDYNRKRKAMNLALQATKKHVESERIRMANASNLIARVWRAYWRVESLERKAKAARDRDKFLLEREEKREKEKEMRSIRYKLLHKVEPEKYPLLPPHEDDHMDEETRSRIYSQRDRLKDIKEQWEVLVQRNMAIRKETRKYNNLRRDINDNLPIVKERVDKFEQALMNEIEKTSKYYVDFFGPVEIKVYEMENQIHEFMKIAVQSLVKLGAMDKLDVRRMMMKHDKNIRSLLPFQHIEKAEFYEAIDWMKVKEFGDGEIICEEGEPGDEFYILTDGTVVVTGIDIDGEIIELARLQKGVSFGEMALVNPDGLRTATCVAEGPVRTFYLTRRKFETLLSQRSREVINFEVGKILKKHRRTKKHKHVVKLIEEEHLAADAAARTAMRAARISDAVRAWAKKNQWRNSVSRERGIVARRVAQQALSFVKGKMKHRFDIRELSNNLVKRTLDKATLAITRGLLPIGLFDAADLTKFQLDLALAGLGHNLQLPDYFDYEEQYIPQPSARSLGSFFSGLDEDDKEVFETIEYDLMSLEGDGMLLLHEMEQMDAQNQKSLMDEGDEAKLFEEELVNLDRQMTKEDRAMRREEMQFAKDAYALDQYNWLGSEYTTGTFDTANLSFNDTFNMGSRPNSAVISRPQSAYSLNSENIRNEVMSMADNFDHEARVSDYGNYAATEIQKIVRGWNVRKQPVLLRMREWYGVDSSRREEDAPRVNKSVQEYDAFIYGSFAATEIQKIVRGWNVRKQPTLLKMKEWYDIDSIVGSDNNTPRDIVNSMYVDRTNLAAESRVCFFFLLFPRCVEDGAALFGRLFTLDFNRDIEAWPLTLKPFLPEVKFGLAYKSGL